MSGYMVIVITWSMNPDIEEHGSHVGYFVDIHNGADSLLPLL